MPGQTQTLQIPILCLINGRLSYLPFFFFFFFDISHFIGEINFLFYYNSVPQAPGGVVGSHFAAVLTSAFLSFAAAHMVNYYHFMVTVISNLVENDS